jgi:nucleotide-binding universal stress UspA family protein
LAKTHGARLFYVYAVDLTFLKGGKTGSITSQGVEESLAGMGRHILDRAGELAAAEGVTPEKLIVKGPVLGVLKKVVQEKKADLLVLGHEDRSFFEKFLIEGDVEDHIQSLKEETGVDVLIIR